MPTVFFGSLPADSQFESLEKLYSGLTPRLTEAQIKSRWMCPAYNAASAP